MAQMLCLTLLQPHPNNPRRVMDQEYIAELVASMGAHGQWDAILVRPVGDTFQIVAGHCRVEAARLLGWSEIRAEVKDLTDEEADFLTLDTNLKRKSLSPIEEAEGFRRMINTHGWSQREVAEKFSKTHTWVQQRLSLLDLVPEVQEQVATRVASITHARFIAQAPPDIQPSIARKVQVADLSTRQTEALVKVMNDPAIQPEVKKALLESPKMTPEHAVAIAQSPSLTTRQDLIKDTEAGQITAEEAGREAWASARLAEMPRSIPVMKVEQRMAVLSQTKEAEAALLAINQGMILELDGGDLTDVEYSIRRLADQVQKLSTWLTMVRDRQRSKPKAAGGRVLNLPHR